MKIPCFSRKHRISAIQILVAVMLAVLLVFSVGPAMSSSSGQESAAQEVHDAAAEAEHAAEGGGHGKGWV